MANEDPRLAAFIAALDAPQGQAPSAPAAPPPGQEDAALQAFIGALDGHQDAPLAAPAGAPAGAPAPQGDPQAYSAPAAAPISDPAAWQAEATRRSQQFGAEPGLTDPTSTADAIIGGGAKAAFETKDFVLGDTPQDQRSGVRAAIEDGTKKVAEESLFDGFAAGIAQFGVGMLGAGKLTSAAKMLPWFGKAATAVAGSGKLKATAEAAKAAAVGAVAFDPYEQRLSHLIEGTPLANPVSAWLKADPTDSRAAGRMKAALESLGLDAALAGTFLAAGKTYKALRAGNAEEAAKGAAEIERIQNRAAKEAEADVPALGDEPSPPLGEAPQQPLAAEAAGAPEAQPAQGVPGEAPPAAAVASDTGLPSDPAVSQVVDTPTQALSSEGVSPDGRAVGFKPPSGDDIDPSALLDGMASDADAIAKHGSWWGAVEAGHTFGRGAKVPWVKLNAATGGKDDFMARIADAAEARLNAAKGGDVLGDARVEKMIGQRAALFEEDPALLIGMVQQSGKAAARMVADMEAGYLVSQRMLQDSFALANRIQLGDLSAFKGNREAALAELKQRVALTAEVYGGARSITANAGRAVRRMRQEFVVDQKLLETLNGMDGEQLAALIVNTGGNPKDLAKLVKSGMLGRVRDYAQYVLVNNLVSGPKTQLINIATNGYMMGARPLEKMLGGSAQFLKAAAKGDGEAMGSANRVVREAAKQYGYMRVALRDGFEQAKTAFVKNDSILQPHRAEVFRANQISGGPVPWKPMDSLYGVLHNGAMAAHVAIGLPTRSLGFVDELVKQTVYRSKVLSAASIDGMDEGLAQGLKGPKLDAFVKQYMAEKLDAAFDDMGMGLDPAALREAQVATFQQELKAGSLGHGVQQFASNWPSARFLLPFIKTPTNVIRYAWKMTPMLNVLQTEYRAAIRGELGGEMQAEAVGQMVLGSTFMGLAATLAAEGKVTGGGPADPKLKQELMATGWQPYSFVSTNKDGSKTFTPFGRFDPVSTPFGMVADLVDAMSIMERDDDEGVQAAMGAVFYGLTQQFRSKSYLLNLTQTMDALIASDETGDGTARWAGQMVSNFVPFSALQRQVNPDPYLREARDVVDRVKATIPGLSETVPARYDAWGDPVVAHAKGLWANDEGNAVDTEMQRLAIENGSAITRVQPRPQAGVDLREITMANGKNAYEEYQRLSGHPRGGKPLKEVVAKLIASPAYKRAPDGDVGTKGTKLWILAKPVAAYRNAAMQGLKADPNVRAALMKKQMDVAAKYAAGRDTAGPEAGLGAIGKAFGVDLGQ